MKHFYMNVFFCWRIETNFSRKQKYSYFAINKLFSDYDKYQFKIQIQTIFCNVEKPNDIQSNFRK